MRISDWSSDVCSSDLRTLDPQLDLWAVAQPVLADILREQRRPRAIAKRLRAQLPGWLKAAPHMPGLLHSYLQQAVHGDASLRLRSEDLADLANVTRRSAEHTSELQSLMRISYAVFCLKN